MNHHQQVVTSYVLYEEEKIVSQGSFQVQESQGVNTFPGVEGVELAFYHYYQDTLCKVELECRKNGKALYALELDIPINRTKLKWKQVKVGESCDLYYRSTFERAT